MFNASAMIDATIRDRLISACISATDSSIVSVILYGSVARGNCDQFSDLDLLCISDTKTRINKSLSTDKRTIDLSIVNEVALRECLDNRRWKENYIILALCEGQILYDPRGTAGALIDEARTLWQAGTVDCTPEKAAMLIMTLSKLRTALYKLCARLESLPQKSDARELLLRHLDHIQHKVMTYYCRANRRWFFPSWVLKTMKKDSFYEDAIRYNHEYFLAIDLPAKAHAIKTVADLTELLLQQRLAAPAEKTHQKCR